MNSNYLPLSAALIACFLYLYNVPFVFLPVGTRTLVAAVGGVLLVFETLTSRRPAVSRRLLLVIASFGSLAIASILSTSYHQKYDFMMALDLFLVITQYPLGAFLVIALLCRCGSDNSAGLIRLFIMAILLQAVISVLMLVNEPFRAQIYALNRHDFLEAVNIRYGGFRALGLATALAYDLGVIQGIGLILTVLAVANGLIGGMFASFAGTLMVVSVVVSSRTGLFPVVGSTFIVICWIASTRNVRRLLRFLPLAIVLFGSIGAWAFSARDSSPMIEKIFDYSSEVFYTDSREKILTDLFESHYYWPGVDVFLFGTGEYLSNPQSAWRYTGETDSGYLRFILVFGAPMSLALYACILYMWKCAKDRLIQDKIFMANIAFYWILGTLFFAHIKGQFLLHDYSLGLLWPFFLLSTRRTGSTQPQWQTGQKRQHFS